MLVTSCETFNIYICIFAMTNDAAILTNLKPSEFTFPSCISINKIIYFKHDKLQVFEG